MNILQFSAPSERHLGRAIQLQAAQHGDKPYLLFDETVYTFAEVNQRVNELAAGLARAGLKAGERLAFYMSSAPEVVFLVLATNKLGAVWVLINTDYKGAWLRDTINSSRPTILVSPPSGSLRGMVRTSWVMGAVMGILCRYKRLI